MRWKYISWWNCRKYDYAWYITCKSLYKNTKENFTEEKQTKEKIKKQKKIKRKKKILKKKDKENSKEKITED